MTFLDALEGNFKKMLEYRAAAGYATATYVSMVTPFINFCGNAYPDAAAITREMVDRWLESRGYSINNQAAFIACLRQYARFINFLGGKAFIPDEDYSIRRTAYEPYLFTGQELSLFFDSVDGCVPRTSGRKCRPDLVLPPLFRLMYCCGMRPGEPLRLLCGDVNLESGDIYIRETKSHKDRHIIMSEDMRELCREYNARAGERTWFFEYKGKPYSTKWMTSRFCRCWKNSGIQAHGTPRPYDLRHAFASHNLMRWIDRKLDVMALLPFLSSYMGHSELTSTLYYVHLLPDRLRKSSGIDWTRFSDIYGKAGDPDET